MVANSYLVGAANFFREFIIVNDNLLLLVDQERLVSSIRAVPLHGVLNSFLELEKITREN
jgi:hypothetical protein